MDSVFALSTDEELEFDAMFDQEDSLIDTVNGVNEAGEPLTGVDFEELHQTEDEATPDDVKDDLTGDDVTNGAPNPEGTKEPEKLDTSVDGEVGKESEADKVIDGAEQSYQDGTDESKPVEDNVTDTIDKVTESEDIDDVLDGEEDDDLLPADESGDIDSILDPVNETETGADSDVDAVVKDEESTDNKDIDDVLDSKDDNSTSTNLDYDVSDEELIDMVSNGDN